MVLQLEEVDSLKATLSATNLNTSDFSSSSQDDINTFDHVEPGVPGFQVHFSVPTSNTKNTDSNRGKKKNIFFHKVFEK